MPPSINSRIHCEKRGEKDEKSATFERLNNGLSCSYPDIIVFLVCAEEAHDVSMSAEPQHAQLVEIRAFVVGVRVRHDLDRHLCSKKMKEKEKEGTRR